jgi:adenylate cyclase
MWWFGQRHQTEERRGPPFERPLRLTTGLILFCYAISHLINHAFGIRSLEAMQAASVVLLAPWQTYPGLILIYTSFFVHGTLGLRALYRRRHLRIPASEVWQLALGLAIPLLLISHAGSLRIGHQVYGLEAGYPKVLYTFWVASPDFALPRQMLLILVVWIHGCIGIRAWLRSKRWYGRAAAPLASVATLIPALAIAGFVSAGLDLRDLVEHNPALTARYAAPAPNTEAGHKAAARERVVDTLLLSYLGLLAGALALRALRDWRDRRLRGVRITYPGGRIVTVPAGFTVLEASRWAGIPHASICGGRGRCSTCRVRIVNGPETAGGPIGPNERGALERLGAPPRVRLACQIRPTADVSVEPLVPATFQSVAAPARFEAAVEGGRELEISAMFVDLRGSTRLATGRLPYDALFLFDRYIQVVTGAVRANRGHVTSIAGDGVMSVFGVTGNAASASRDAFQAALNVWGGIASLNEELAAELEAPLRVGIGLHAGMAVVGWIASSETQSSLQFLGDTGNITAKLEEHTKLFDCTLVASSQALRLIVPSNGGLETASVSIAGKADRIEVVILRDRAELQRLMSSIDASPVGVTR